MDKIIIKGLRVYAYHGVNPEEKRDGQHFELDITAEADLRAAGASDDLRDTVSYAKIAKSAVRVMAGQSCNLLERAATLVAEQLLEEFPTLRRVAILLKKPEAPINLPFSYMAVQICRERADESV